MKSVVCSLLVAVSSAVTVKFYPSGSGASCPSDTGASFAHMYRQYCTPFAGSPYYAITVDFCNQTWMNGTRWYMDRSQSGEPPPCGYPARAELFSLQLSSSACQPMFDGLAKVIDGNCTPSATLFAVGAFPDSTGYDDKCSPSLLRVTDWSPAVASQTCNVGAYNGAHGAVAVASNSSLRLSVYLNFRGMEGACPSGSYLRRWSSASIGSTSCTPSDAGYAVEYLRVLPLSTWVPSPTPSATATASVSSSPAAASATPSLSETSIPSGLLAPSGTAVPAAGTCSIKLTSVGNCSAFMTPAQLNCAQQGYSLVVPAYTSVSGSIVPLTPGSGTPVACPAGVVQLAPLHFRVPVAAAAWSDGLQAVISDADIVTYDLLPVGPNAVAVQLVTQTSSRATLRLCGMLFGLTAGACLGKVPRAQDAGQGTVLTNVAIGTGVGAAVGAVLGALYTWQRQRLGGARVLVGQREPRVVVSSETVAVRMTKESQPGDAETKGLQMNPLVAG